MTKVVISKRELKKLMITSFVAGKNDYPDKEFIKDTDKFLELIK